MLAPSLVALRPSPAATHRFGDTIRAVVDRSPRTNVSYLARCELGFAVIIGEICDASAGGVFFRYEHGYVDGVLRHGVELLGELVLGDKVQIVVDDPRAPAGAFAAEVRWSGVGRHGPGLGARRMSAELEHPGGPPPAANGGCVGYPT